MTDAHWIAEYLRARGEVLELLPVGSHTRNRQWDSSAAYKLHADWHRRILYLARAHVQAYSQYRWIYYLRRADHEFFTYNRQNQFGWRYDQTLAETIAGYSTKYELPKADDQGRFVFERDYAAVIRTYRLIALAKLLSNVQGSMRRASKGQRFRSHRTGFPEPIQTHRLQECINLFDSRNQINFQQSTENYGNSQLAPWTPREGKTADMPLVLIGRVSPGELVPVWRGPLHDFSIELLPGKFHAGFHSLSKLKDIIARSGGMKDVQWWENDLPAFTVFMLASSLSLLSYNTNAGQNIPYRGYFIVNMMHLKWMIALILESETSTLKTLFGDELSLEVSQVVECIETLTPQALPLKPARILHPFGDKVVIDLHSASDRFWNLSCISTHTRSPRVRQERDLNFESNVQSIVTQLEWGPSTNDPLPGQDLYLDTGRRLTNIDALAVKGKTLLYLSCKAYPYTYALYGGVGPEVAAESRKVESDVRELRRKIERLQDVTSFDFTRYEQIIGCVILPHVPYVTGPLSRTVIARTKGGRALYAAAALGELESFLSDW